MAVSFKVDSNVDKVISEKDKAVEMALTMIGQQVINYTTMKCPVKTGNLRRSYTKDVNPKEETVTVGTNVEYAPYVEYGHMQEVGRYVPALGKRLVAPKVDARPHLRPAVNDHKDEYKKIAEQCLKNV